MPSEYLELVNEVLDEEFEILMDFLNSEVKPLIEFRKELEYKIATKAIAEMYKAEQEVK